MLIKSSENMITPSDGNGMLRIEETTLVASQVRQVVDISAHAADIDAGFAYACFEAEYNAKGDPNHSPRASAVLSAYEAGTVGQGAPLSEKSVREL